MSCGLACSNLCGIIYQAHPLSFPVARMSFASKTIRVITAASMVLLGFVNVTHFHFPSSASVASAASSVLECSCASHDHSSDQSPSDSPSDDDCPICKVIADCNAQAPVECSLAVDRAYSFFQTKAAQCFWIPVVSDYFERGPPAIRISA